jgi:hypothetical protein
MVRTYGPMMSLDASGSLGNAITFSKWKGRNYARERVIPHNPKSVSQTGIRAMFSFLSKQWAAIGSTPQASWDELAAFSAISPFNAFVAHCMNRFRDFLPPTQDYPAAAAGTPCTISTPVCVAGERSITVTVGVTAAEDGWGIGLFRSLSGTFTGAWDNLIAVKPIDGTNDVVFVDSPLDPDQYFYEARAFTTDGVWGDATAEDDATIS